MSREYRRESQHVAAAGAQLVKCVYYFICLQGSFHRPVHN